MASVSQLPQEEVEYREQAQWDTPQPVEQVKRLTDLLDGRCLRSRMVIDAGAGTGRNSAFLAKRGYQVTAVDMEPGATSALHRLAKEECLKDRLAVSQNNILAELSKTLRHSVAAIVDIGLSHCLTDSEKRQYAGLAASALEPRGLLSLLHFSEHEQPNAADGRSKSELREIFKAAGFHSAIPWRETSWQDRKTGDVHHAWTVTLESKNQ